MDIEQIRSALTSEINPTSLSELDENELASVLVIIYGKEPTILMTEKAKTLKVHAGEIAFPGGKWCTKDKDLLETAIRETKEELCLEVSKEQVVGQLDSVITLNSKYKITPFATRKCYLSCKNFQITCLLCHNYKRTVSIKYK